MINKTISLSLLLLFSSAGTFANKIDELKTPEEAKKFIAGAFKEFESFKLADTDAIFRNKAEKKVADSLKIKYWDKADFDSNGETDMLAYGSMGDAQLIIILAMPGDKYVLKKIHRGFIPNTTMYPLVSAIGKQPVIKLYKTPSKESYIKNKVETKPSPMKVSLDTLVYKFGSFMEYNSAPKKVKMDDLKFSTSKCFGACPVFSLSINAAGDAEYSADEYNKVKGKFKGKIDKARLDTLTEILSYIRIEKLSAKYSVGWTDDQSVTLKVNANGQAKQIEDYGMMGTYGLNRLYKFLFDLRDNQVWK